MLLAMSLNFFSCVPTPPCYLPDLSLLMLQVIWCMVIKWDTVNAFVTCLEILDTVFGHLTCLSSFSQLYSEVFRPLSCLKPFPRLPTLVVPPLWNIGLLSSISVHNSCVSYSLPSPLSHNFGCSQNEFFYCKLRWGPPCGGSTLACQALASGFWSSLDKREGKSHHANK